MSSILLWPELYGFHVYGNGPAFVIYVEDNSKASSAGLKPGDQIVELNGRNVVNLSANAIKFLANNCADVTPSISVKSKFSEFEFSVKHKSSKSFEFEISGNLPVVFQYVNEKSAAFDAGIRQGN